MITLIYPDGREQTREDQKFSCRQLSELVGGNFRLSYAYTEKGEVSPKHPNQECNTDYWIACRETHGLTIAELPEYNTAVKEMFNKDVYGLAIIAPHSCF